MEIGDTKGDLTTRSGFHFHVRAAEPKDEEIVADLAFTFTFAQQSQKMRQSSLSFSLTLHQTTSDFVSYPE